MTAPELHARLTAASALVADFRAEQERSPASRPPDSWALRLALAAESLSTALRGALAMLEDADDVIADQDTSGVIVTGGLSISPEDAPTVMAALADAARCADDEHFPSSPSEELAARYRELADRIGGQQ